MGCRFILPCILLVHLIWCWSEMKYSRYSEEWTSLTLTQTWPPTLCQLHQREGWECRIPPIINTWQIHGLWPTGGSHIENCTISTKFNYHKIKSLEPKLQRYWRNFDTKTRKDKLWEHEWEKHGRCVTTLKEISNEYLYFEKTLQLREKYPIERFLSEEGITCNRNYAVHEIKGAIEQKTGKEPYIVCAENQDRFARLYEIRICFDKEFQVIDCGIGAMIQIQKRMEIQNLTYSALISGQHCGDNVYYPPLK